MLTDAILHLKKILVKFIPTALNYFGFSGKNQLSMLTR